MGVKINSSVCVFKDVSQYLLGDIFTVGLGVFLCDLLI